MKGLHYQVAKIKGLEDYSLGDIVFTARAGVVHLNFRAQLTFPVPVSTVPSSMDRTSRCYKIDAVRLYASYRLNLLLLKEQRCVTCTCISIKWYFI